MECRYLGSTVHRIVLPTWLYPRCQLPWGWEAVVRLCIFAVLSLPMQWQWLPGNSPWLSGNTMATVRFILSSLLFRHSTHLVPPYMAAWCAVSVCTSGQLALCWRLQQFLCGWVGVGMWVCVWACVGVCGYVWVGWCGRVCGVWACVCVCMGVCLTSCVVSTCAMCLVTEVRGIRTQLKTQDQSVWC